MDAVRRVIDDLRGTVEVKSQKGRGTEIKLRLPLMLAIIDGLLVKVAGGPFVLPLSNVEECVELPRDENSRQSGRSILRIRDQLVPYVSLDTLFGFERMESDVRRVVITSVDGRRTGLVVDEVVGQHQTVIKPLTLRGNLDRPGPAAPGDMGTGQSRDRRGARGDHRRHRVPAQRAHLFRRTRARPGHRQCRAPPSARRGPARRPHGGRACEGRGIVHHPPVDLQKGLTP